jgi:hypothetical protein
LAIILPKTKQIADDTKISKLILISHQGIGKTTAVSLLDNCLLLDYENGSKQVGGFIINLIEESNSSGNSLLKTHFEVVEAIKKENQELGKFKYKYLAIDNVSALEKLAKQKATIDFKNSVVGKGMLNKGVVINDVVTDVPEAGWLWFFRAWDDLYMSLQGLAEEALILIAHSKQGSLIKDGQKLDASDMNLTGKCKLDLLRDVDACGFLYRKSPTQVHISFKTNEKDLTTKGRASQIWEQDFLFSERNENGNITTYWDKIFKNKK